MSKLEVRTLCGRCASYYIEAGYHLERMTHIRHEFCEFCGYRNGLDYAVIEKKKKKHENQEKI